MQRSRLLTPAEHAASVATINARLDALNFNMAKIGSRYLDGVFGTPPTCIDPALAAAISADLDALGLDDTSNNQSQTVK